MSASNVRKRRQCNSCGHNGEMTAEEVKSHCAGAPAPVRKQAMWPTAPREQFIIIPRSGVSARVASIAALLLSGKRRK